MSGPHGSTQHLALSRRGTETTQTGPENLGPYLNRVIWALAALTTLFVALRVYCKFLRRRQLWWDDYVLLASWVALVVSVALQSVGVSHCLGRHYSGLTVEESVQVSIYSMSAGFCSILATCWSKTSFAISLLRISTGKVRMFVWFIIISVNIVLGSNGLVQWIQCWPVQKRWYYDLDGYCFPSRIIQDYNTFFAAFSGLMDIVLALLPWKIIWTVAINKREKLGAMIVMSVGVIAGVMAFLKIKTVYVIGNDNSTTVDLFIFGTAEPATAIMAASIPVLRTLIRRDHPKPARFIELGDNRLRVRSAAANRPGAGTASQIGSEPRLVAHDGKSVMRRSADEEKAEASSWTLATATKVCHLETVHVRRGSRDEEVCVGGGGSTDRLTDGLGIPR